MRRIVPLIFVLAACTEPSRQNPVSPDLGLPSLAVVPGQRVFRTHLVGANELPPSPSLACGLTFLELFEDPSSGKLSIYWRTRISNPGQETFFAGYVAGPAPAGSYANAQFHLFSGSTSALNIDHSGSSPIDPTLALKIQTNPQDYYVNYTSVERGAGTIRGQLSNVNPPQGLPACYIPPVG